LDAAKRLVENRKLVARTVIHGRFCGTNEPFELEGRSIIYPTTGRRKMGYTEWSLIIEMISTRMDDRKKVH